MEISFKEKCSFCGKSKSEVKDLYYSQVASICDECIKVCNELSINANNASKKIVNDPRITIDEQLCDIIDRNILIKYDIIPIEKVGNKIKLLGYIHENMDELRNDLSIVKKSVKNIYNLDATFLLLGENSKELILNSLKYYFGIKRSGS